MPAGISKAPATLMRSYVAPSRFDRAGRAGEQIGADRIVVARLDDEEAAAFEARRSCGGPARLGHRSDLLGCIRDGASP